MLRFMELLIFELFLLSFSRPILSKISSHFVVDSFESSSSSSGERHFIRSLSDDSDEQVNEGGTIWAVLVAGSSGWYNYRHQADVCHAWHTLVNHGVNPDNIVTMMYDDIAHNKHNPYPGKLYNNPNGKDVYTGVRIDYKGEDVNPENFMSVLLGDEDAVDGKKVLKSTKYDKVFIYFTDHGGDGLICFPSDILTVKNLSDTLKGMHQKELYKELTFYLEACESGSMFEWKLMDSMEIYAVTAANSDESSWGCYCETKILPGNCLGDLFSVNWMEDSDKENLQTETLSTQFTIVKRETNTSHVQEFGNLNIQAEHVAEFMGEKQTEMMDNRENSQTPHQFAMYPARDIPLMMLARDPQNGHKLRTHQKKRRYLEKQMTRLVRKVLHDPVNQERALSTYPSRISQLECHHQVMHTFNNFCFNFAKNPYALKYAYVLTNLCEHRIQPERIRAIMMDHCADVDVKGIL